MEQGTAARGFGSAGAKNPILLLAEGLAPFLPAALGHVSVLSMLKSPLTPAKLLAASVGTMSGASRNVTLCVVLVAACLATPVAGRAQDASIAPCQLCSTTPSEVLNAAPAAPLRLQVETRLDFDKVVFEGNGSAMLVLSPNGTVQLSGATAAGARAMPGSVTVRGEPGRAVRIDLPKRVLLFGDGNGSISIDSLTTDLPSFPRIGPDGTLSFRFGGDLRLGGESDGAFRGSIDIVVDYL
jgi:hypothetical protein